MFKRNAHSETIAIAENAVEKTEMRDDRLAAESYAMVLRMNAISRPPYFALLLGMTLLTLSGCRSKDTLTATGDRGKPIHLGDRIEWVTATHGLPDKVHLFELLNQ